MRARSNGPNPLDASTVVIADGDSGVRESLRMILGPHHCVYTASCAEALFDLLVRDSVNVVVLDLHLPGAPACDLIRGLRREFPDVALVVVTAQVSLDEATEALRSGVTDLVRKPFDVNEIGAAVARAVGGQRQRARLVGFLRALGQLVGKERHVGAILREVEQSPPLRQRLSDLVSRASRQATRHQHLREVTTSGGDDRRAAPSATNEGAWT